MESSAGRIAMLKVAFFASGGAAVPLRAVVGPAGGRAAVLVVCGKKDKNSYLNNVKLRRIVPGRMALFYWKNSPGPTLTARLRAPGLGYGIIRNCNGRLFIWVCMSCLDELPTGGDSAIIDSSLAFG